MKVRWLKLIFPRNSGNSPTSSIDLVSSIISLVLEKISSRRAIDAVPLENILIASPVAIIGHTSILMYWVNDTKLPRDMLPLMGNQGYAWLSFYDKRFTIPEIIGKSVIIHEKRDDFASQPSGDAGEKIGCGVIVAEK